MADQEKWWVAFGIQTGTNQRMMEKAQTKNQVDIKMFGRGYAARRESVTYGRIDAPVGENQ